MPGIVFRTFVSFYFKSNCSLSTFKIILLMVPYLTAVVIIADLSTGELRARKYRKIANRERDLRIFERFAFGIPGAVHINYYHQDNKRFAFQRKNPA
jgi:hypothetical protein